MAVPQPTGHQINNVQGDRAALLSALHQLDPEAWKMMAGAVAYMAANTRGLTDVVGWARVRLACDDILPGGRGAW